MHRLLRRAISFLALSSAAGRAGDGPVGPGALPQPPHSHHRSVHGGNGYRRAGAGDGPEAGRPPEGRRRRRKSSRRERQHRDRSRREGHAGRLYAADDGEHACDQRGAAAERSLRSCQELHADRTRRDRQSRARGSPLGAGALRAGARRTRQSATRQAQLRVTGQRHAASSRDGALQAAFQGGPHARSVQGNGGRRHRLAGRSGAGDVPAGARGLGPCPGRKAAHARRRWRPSVAGDARRSFAGRRRCHRHRRRHLVRDARAGRVVERADDAAQRRDERHPRRSGSAREPPEAGFESHARQSQTTSPG